MDKCRFPMSKANRRSNDRSSDKVRSLNGDFLPAGILQKTVTKANNIISFKYRIQLTTPCRTCKNPSEIFFSSTIFSIEMHKTSTW